MKTYQFIPWFRIPQLPQVDEKKKLNSSVDVIVVDDDVKKNIHP